MFISPMNFTLSCVKFFACIPLESQMHWLSRSYTILAYLSHLHQIHLTEYGDLY